MNSDAGFTKDQLQTGLEEINGDLPEADFWVALRAGPWIVSGCAVDTIRDRQTAHAGAVGLR